MTTVDADVCIVGSGLAGAIVAQRCLDAGATVVMLEAGGPAAGRAKRLRLLEFALRSYNTPRMRLWHRGARYRGGDYQSRGPRRYDLGNLALIVRGGSTLGWTGFSYRLKLEDFRLGELAGRGLDWPIDYDELEPFYGMAEQSMRATGDHRDAGHPPRSAPRTRWPVPPS